MRPVRHDLKPDRAFTLTEALAGLVLSGVLMAGLFELTGVGARAAMRAADQFEHARAHRLLGESFGRLERCLLQDTTVAERRLEAEFGETSRLVLDMDGQPEATVLRFRLDTLGGVMTASRVLKGDAPLGLRHDAGGIDLEAARTGRIVARASCLREAPYDCRYDVVSRSCR